MNQYSQYRHKLNNANRANKTPQQNFQEMLAENIKNNSRSFHAYIRNKQRKEDKVVPLKDQNGELLVGDQKMRNYWMDISVVCSHKKMFQTYQS